MSNNDRLMIAQPLSAPRLRTPSNFTRLSTNQVYTCLVGLSVCLGLVGCGAKPEMARAPAELSTVEAPFKASTAAAAPAASMRSLSAESLASDPLSVDALTEHESVQHESVQQELLSDSAAGDTQGIRPLLGNRPKFSSGKSVEVYFATDRLPTIELLPNPLRIFAPVAVFGLLGAAMFIGFSAARRLQGLWLIGCGLAVCLGMIVLHSSIIRYQQYWRLAHNASTQFSTLRDERTRDYPLHVGTATVSLPKHHAPGRMEAPSLLRLEFSEDPAKHIVLRQLRVEGEVEQWFQSLKAEANEEETNESFVFIHGYNVRFEDAVKRTAQLYTDLNISGPAICYSWPSRGQVASYTADEATVSWSSAHFERLLLDLRQRAECSRINIIAHSMGNRALLEAIERLHLRGAHPKSDKLINSLILAAPDVDVDQFHNRFIAPVQNLARHTTVYFSDTDRALQLSAGLHRAPRLGFAHSKIPNVAGIEAIHIGQQSLFALGHSYYGSDVAVIDDMRALLLEGKQAAERPFLTSVARRVNAPEYWQIDRALHAQRAMQGALR